MNRNIAVVSSKVPQICEKLQSFGYKLIYTECVDGFISYEKYHADMQCISVNDKVYVLKGCETLVESLKSEHINVIETNDNHNGKYPNNIKLNIKIIGNYAIGKKSSIDSLLLEELIKNNYQFIDVKQGYSGCSCTKITDNAIITADNSIYKALKNTEIDCLKICDGNIELFGASKDTTGFIGGASVQLDNNNILFFGNIKNHHDYSKIHTFCKKYDVRIHHINEIELTDIGGAILLNNSQ